MSPGTFCPSPVRPAAAAALAAALWLAGCATPPAPPPPPPGPVARLLLRAALPSDDRFVIQRFTDNAACKAPVPVIEGAPNKPLAPATLPAGELTTIEFAILRGDKPACSMRWSFTPLRDRHYLLEAATVGSGCVGRLLDVTTPDRPQPVADAVPRNVGGQTCLPLDVARERVRAAASASAGAALQGGQADGEAVLNPRATTADLQGLIRP